MNYIEEIQNKTFNERYKALSKIMEKWIRYRIFGLTQEDIEDYCHDFATHVLLHNITFDNEHKLYAYVYKWSRHIITHPVGNRRLLKYLKESDVSIDKGRILVNKKVNQYDIKTIKI